MPIRATPAVFVLIFVLAHLSPAPVAEAQAGKVYRVGFLGGASASGYVSQMEALRLGLRDHGYVEGRNITIEYRWAEGKYDRLPALAAELVRLKVDVLITQGTPAALVAKQATSTIPIVMAIVGNPVEDGIVASLARPGGNITGSTFFVSEVNGKRLEILKAAVPGLARVAVLINPDNPAQAGIMRVMDQTAQAINIKLQSVKARRLDELDAVFVAVKAHADALVVLEDGVFVTHAKRIAELALRNGVPSVGFREYGEAGGLAAYGVDFPDIWRRSMVLVDKIIKGAKPADLPIQQATRFELIVNLRTANALGVTFPPSLLLRADQVIE